MFRAAVRAHLARLAADSIMLDAIAPRRNVLVYYGVGGVGKTELSRRLARWVNGQFTEDDVWRAAPDTRGRPLVTVRLDCNGSVVDPVGFLTDLRLALGEVDRRWPAFDLAMMTLRAQRQPLEPDPFQMPRRRKFANEAEQLVENVLDDVLGSSLAAGLTVRSVARIAEAIRARRLRAKALNDCWQLPDILDHCVADPSAETAASLAGLLSWELGQMPVHERPLVVAFVDAFEHLSTDPTRRSESILNVMAFLLPHLLWVITGHDPLDWAEAGVPLGEVGPDKWPGLAHDSEHVPGQHRVAGLSRRDARAFLEMAAGDRVSGAVLSKAVDTSAGMPLRLNIVRNIIADRLATGRTVEMADVTGPVSAVTLRLIHGMPPDEQRALRTAAIVPRFDIGLIAAAANVDHAAGERLVRRSVIESRDNPFFPYRVHDETRPHLREEHPNASGAWASADWRAAGARLLEEIGRRHKASDDAAERLELTTLGLWVVADTGADSSWLLHAIVDAPSLTALAVRRPFNVRSPAARPYVDFLSCSDPSLPREERAKRYLITSETAAGAMRRVALRHYAYSLRIMDHHDEALRVFQGLESSVTDPAEQQQVAYQIANTLMRARRFRQAEDALDKHRLSASETEMIRARIAVRHGRIAEALPAYDRRARELREAGRFRVAGEVRGVGCVWQALLLPEVYEQAAELVAEGEQYRRTDLIRSGIVAQAICRAGHAADVQEHLKRGADLVRRLGQDVRTASWALARAFDAAVRTDRDELVALIAELPSYRNRADSRWIPVEMLLAAFASHYSDFDSETEWLEDASIVCRRFAGLVLNRRCIL